jgi:hypothetical protein
MKRFLMLSSFAVLGAAVLTGCGSNNTTNCNPSAYPNGILPAACYGNGAQNPNQPPNWGQQPPNWGGQQPPPGWQQPPVWGAPPPQYGGGFVYGPPPPPWFYPCGGNPYCYF